MSGSGRSELWRLCVNREDKRIYTYTYADAHADSEFRDQVQ